MPQARNVRPSSNVGDSLRYKAGERRGGKEEGGGRKKEEEEEQVHRK